MVAVVVSNWTPLGGAIGLGISSIVGLIMTLLIIKPKLSYTLYDSDRLTQQVGTTGILPQFLAHLAYSLLQVVWVKSFQKVSLHFYLKATI